MIVIAASKFYTEILNRCEVSMIEPEFIDISTIVSICYNIASKQDKGIQWLVSQIEEVAVTGNFK